MLVRQLTTADLAAYRALHRFGMIEAPLGFVDVPETDASRPDAEVEAMLARGEGWGAFDGERLIGKLTVDALRYPSLAHTFWVHAVYVHPNWVHEMKKMVRYGVHSFYRPFAWGNGEEEPVWGNPSLMAASANASAKKK